MTMIIPLSVVDRGSHPKAAHPLQEPYCALENAVLGLDNILIRLAEDVAVFRNTGSESGQAQRDDVTTF